MPSREKGRDEDLTNDSIGVGTRASIASIASIFSPRRLRAQAWVDVVVAPPTAATETAN